MLHYCKKFIALISITVFILVLLTACTKDSTNPEPDPPAIPPQSTMMLDLSGFPTSNNLPKVSQALEGTGVEMTIANWSWAATNVFVWSTYVNLINLTLSVPFAAFVGTINEDPQYQGDAKWLWEKTFPVLGVQHTSQLYGSLEGSNVVWEMYITKADVYSDFLWYRGEADVDATEGYWEFYKDPENPTPFLRIDWHRTEDQKGDIKYTNADPNSADYGSYIFYDLLDSGDFDAAFDMFSASKSNHTSVEWHRVNKNGRVMDNDHFGDTDWHCWDTTLTDIDCP